MKRVGEEEHISGGFADVYRGKLNGGQVVAIKRFQVFRRTSETDRPMVIKVV